MEKTEHLPHGQGTEVQIQVSQQHLLIIFWTYFYFQHKQIKQIAHYRKWESCSCEYKACSTVIGAQSVNKLD